MSEKNFRIEVGENAFDREQQRSQLSSVKEPYNAKIAEMNRAVEALDRYDDFSMLKIDPYALKKRAGSRYGIEEKQGFNDGVILEHQKAAALAFLRELRGFGLLADVVGSGKTYEACLVLSELAVRNKVRSLLLVVPEQVYATWVDVLEEQFGLGAGVLQAVGADIDISRIECERAGGFLRPLRPVIVRAEDFVEWPEETKRLLFDVIVVDEAHHLCAEEGKYARAMKLLSLFMETKKKANMTYCLLLSATPHSGNLEHMFRLWYFIRCKGGNPSDFDEKEDKERSEEYNKEKAYYKQHVCRGAATVMEFIKKVKLAEVTQSHGAAFDEYLQKTHETNFAARPESERTRIVQEFLDGAPQIRADVLRRVAGAYHNGVLRSIMIRQPHNFLTKKKELRSYLFFPMQEAPAPLATKGLNGEELTIDLSDLYGEHAVAVNGKTMPLMEYIAEVRGNRTLRQAYAEMIGSRIVNTVGAKPPVFTKVGSGAYYWEQMRELPPDAAYRLVPYRYDGNGDGFAHKYEVAKQILRRHRGERVLVFFDYELKKEECLADRFEQALRADAEFAPRLLTGTASDKAGTVEQFRAREDAVLVVKDAAFTEGVNLQDSSVIINFQVTPDPLAMDQRIGRIFRLGQTHNVRIYSLADMHRLEGYVLLYFLRIGLMSSSSGDATIIAGSNNERMVTVRCPVCGNVRLYSLEEYELRKKRNDLYCAETERCRENDPNGTRMEEISVYDFRCDACDSVFARSVSEEGYLCMSVNERSKGVMCNSGEYGDREVYCRKICALSHCGYFEKTGLAERCAALKKYREDRNTSESDLMQLCELCTERDCLPKCRIGIGAEAIASCSVCEYATCSPRPHVIRFDEKWEADCPVCAAAHRRGRIRPVLARTFATYIRSAWDFRHDGGAGFCKNLREEAAKVRDIKDILENDGEPSR